MNFRKYGHQEYLKFCEYEGSQHIASEFAIIKLLELVRTFDINSILEIGLGIGSISSTILSVFQNSELDYVGTETNEFCLKSLQKNLQIKDFNRLKIVASLNEALSLDIKYDLVIIDGSYDNINNIKNYLSKNAILTIEGDRKLQEMDIKSIFPSSKFVSMLSYKKNDTLSNRNPDHWQGGIKVFFINPTTIQNIFWFKEKVKTKFGYFYRNNIYKH